MDRKPAPAVTIDRRLWRQGVLDGFSGKRPAARLITDHSYLSGHVEGAAWKEQGADLEEKLQRYRIPHPVPPR
jgi:hypothetical protein